MEGTVHGNSDNIVFVDIGPMSEDEYVFLNLSDCRRIIDDDIDDIDVDGDEEVEAKKVCKARFANFKARVVANISCISLEKLSSVLFELMSKTKSERRISTSLFASCWASFREYM